MNLLHDMGATNIKEAIRLHPRIGEILDRFAIGCTGCSVGTCLLQDVVAVHFLGDQAEAQIEREINDYLQGTNPAPSPEPTPAGPLP